jgi:hypothetical protein
MPGKSGQMSRQVPGAQPSVSRHVSRLSRAEWKVVDDKLCDRAPCVTAVAGPGVAILALVAGFCVLGVVCVVALGETRTVDLGAA